MEKGKRSKKKNKERRGWILIKKKLNLSGGPVSAFI